MTNDILAEHIRTLVQLSGMRPDQAKRLFDQPLYVALDPAVRQNRTYRLAFAYAVNLLTRLFPTTQFDQSQKGELLILPWAGTAPLPASHRPETILVFGKSTPVATAHTRVVTANCHDWHVVIGGVHDPDPDEAWNPMLALSTACYAAARMTKVLLGDAVDGPEQWQPFSILDFRNGVVGFDWSEPLDVGDLYMAGVGAVGSATIFAISAHGTATGRLVLLDHDRLEGKNLGRYTFFDSSEVGKPKAEMAKARLDRMGLVLRVEAIPERFEKYYDTRVSQNNSFGIPRLISAPDRRDTRRQFQSRLPRELWDASTGPDQVILHHNSFRPNLACLSCIYPETPDENAHWEHVADTLNLPVERVRSGELITAEDAANITSKYPDLSESDVLGRAFDSVFRELCSAGRLRGSDAAVLAPFSFISALAGVMLYFEFIKSLRPDVFGPYQQYNYTQLNPFFPPNPDFRELRLSRPDCPCCQNPIVRRVFSQIWG